MNFLRRGNVEDKERFFSAMGGGAILLYALGARGPLGAALSALGKALIVRGATSFPGPPAAQVKASVTIGRPLEEVYRFCRDLTNYPRFMRGLREVKRTGACDLEIVEDVENERIGWRAIDGRGLTRSGVLYLTPAPGGRGVEVEAVLNVAPGGRILGRWAALRRGEKAELVLRGDMRRLKQLLEIGEIPTTRGQPSGEKGR